MKADKQSILVGLAINTFLFPQNDGINQRTLTEEGFNWLYDYYMSLGGVSPNPETRSKAYNKFRERYPEGITLEEVGEGLTERMGDLIGSIGK